MKKLIVAGICLFALISLLIPNMPVEAVVRAPDNAVRTATMDSLFTVDPGQMFTVSGGPIEIVSLFGVCTTAIGTVGATVIELDATAGSDYNRTFSTAVDIDALAVGDLIRFTNAIDEGVLNIDANKGAGQTLSWMCSEGEIELNPTTTSTGAVTWYMSYRRLVPAARVTPN